MERESYKVGLLTFTQGELTWGADKKLIKLFEKFTGKAFGEEELRLKDLQLLLTKYNLIDIFFAIILKPKINLQSILFFNWFRYLFLKKIALNRAGNSQLEQIFDDFFLLNRTLMSKFEVLENILGLIATTMNPEDQKKKPSHSTAKKKTIPKQN